MINVEKSKTIIKPDNRQMDERIPFIHKRCWSRENTFTYHKNNVMLYILIEPEPVELGTGEPLPVDGKGKGIVGANGKLYLCAMPALKKGQIVCLADWQYEITSDCIGVEEIDHPYHHETDLQGSVMSMQKQLFFKYSARRINND